MLGHGCPADRFEPLLLRLLCGRARRRLIFWAHLAVLVCAVFLAVSDRAVLFALAPENSDVSLSVSEPIRLNISWNSGKPVQWRGEFFLSEGVFSDPVPLGKDPGASVTFFCSGDRKKLYFADPDSSAYCGVQVTAALPENGSVNISFRGTKGLENFSKSFSRADLEKGVVRIPFCGEGHDLVIERAPGDTIPLTVCRLDRNGNPIKERFPSLVFEEGESLLLSLSPRRFPAGAENRNLVLTLKPTGKGETVWTQTVPIHSQTGTEDAHIDVTVPVRGIKGAFDLVLELAAPNSSKGKFFIPQYSFSGSGKETAATGPRRVVQGIVLPAQASDIRETGSHFEPSDMRDTLLETIDPTNPSWWKIFARRNGSRGDFKGGENISKTKESDRFDPTSLTSDFLKMWEWGEFQASVKSLTRIPKWGRFDPFWQRSLGSGHLEQLSSNDPLESSFIKLTSSGDPGDPSWESYTVPVKEPGKPHILEIEYLPDYPQKLGVSILEPSVSGGLFPRTLDTGLIVGNEPLSDQGTHRVLRYRVTFWPKTPTPTILLINRDTEKPAVYGRIRIYRAKDEETSIYMADSSKRSMTAVLSRPTFCEQFSAEKAPSTAGVVGAHDWRTFETGTERLAKYLKTCGWDSLLLSVMGDGSGLYPSDLIKPNPVFDSGIFLTEGNDPVRKDVAGYLFRYFERKGLRILPLLSFNAPLPLLESEIRGTGKDSKEAVPPEQFYLIGPRGEPVSVSCGGRQSYPYNILNPIVQREVLRCLDEFAVRYADRPSLREIVLDISADTFTRLPENLYTGLDDETIVRFAEETKLERRCPEKLKEKLDDFTKARDDGRYYRRAVMIRDYLLEDWIQWRAVTVTRFYRNAAFVIKDRMPEASLLLASFRSEEPNGVFPFSASETRFADAEYKALLRRGIDLNSLHSLPNLRLLRSVPVETGRGFGGLSANLSSADSIRLYAPENAGAEALFFRDVEPINLPSFDHASPFHPTVTKISGQFSYSGYQNRERWAKQLAAADTRTLMDGGEMIPMGEEESQGEWISAFRELPAVLFETYIPQNAEPEQESELSAADPIEKTAGDLMEPVVLRYRQEEDGLWGYLVNSAPFHCSTTLSISCSPRAEMEIFTGGREFTKPERKNSGLRWTCSLDPYDLVAFKIADSAALIAAAETVTPKEICGEGGRLAYETENLIDRLRTAAGGVEISLRNSGFEEGISEPVFDRSAESEKGIGDKPILGLDIPKMNLLRNPFAGEKTENTESFQAGGEDLPAGWRAFGGTGIAAADRTQAAGGEASLRLTTGESAGGVIGTPFRLPKTGRLYLDAEFGLPAKLPKEIPFYVTLTGNAGGKSWQRRLPLGNELLRIAKEELQNGKAQDENGVIWVRNSILFDRLPTEETGEFAVRFDLLPHSTLWIDDIRLYKLAFDRTEQNEVAEMTAALKTDLKENRIVSLLSRLSNSAAVMLSEEIPDDSPEMVRRIAMRTKEPMPEQTESKESVSSVEPVEEEEKGFLKRIFPWRR